MKKPVLFITFNRIETTFQVFEAIKKYQPEKLYIAADGPRSHIETDTDNCAAVRKVTDMVDWDCQVFTLFREKNLGCKYAVSSAINWFFDNVEEGIILEDDCLPSMDFFRFCEQMLDIYREHDEIMHIGGVNFQDGISRGDADYYFSTIPHIWGWATWRRAWEKYDVEMSDFPEYMKEEKYTDFFPRNPYIRWRFLLLFRRTYEKSPYFNTWDCQWHYTVVKNRGYSIIPNYNLVSNIGCSGTHNVDSNLCNTAYDALPETLKTANEIKYDYDADIYTFKKNYSGTLKDKLRYLYEFFYSR